MGLVISPLSFYLYLFGYLLPLIGLIPAIIGGTLSTFHGIPGYQLAIYLRIQAPRVVVEGINHVWIQLLSSIFWGPVYGIVGFILDRRKV